LDFGKENLAMETCNLFSVLAHQALDPAVGIRVARLSGEDEFCFFGAEISAGTKLSAHYHRQGPEIYFILAGTGRMSLGERIGDASVAWTDAFDVHAGDCFTIQPGQVHQLENIGTTALNALFGCSSTHLSTDRTVIGDIP
jgi:mannose-6-phosphate isomerase-like protein (cupin superfamily)